MTAGREREEVTSSTLCTAALARLDELVSDSLYTIRHDLPQYLSVPVREHEQHLHGLFRDVLTGLTEGRPPQAEQLDEARALGRARVDQGVAVEAVIGAYHLGYRRLWRMLVAVAGPYGNAAPAEMIGMVDNLWTWITLVTEAAADAYAEADRTRRAAREALRRRFFDAVRAGDVGWDTLLTLARNLGYNPSRRFHTLCSRSEDWSDEQLSKVQRLFDALPDPCHSGTIGASIVVIHQCGDPAAVLDSIRRVEPAVSVGVGLPRVGLEEADAGVVEAEQALAVAVGRGGGTCFFEEEWLTAILHVQRERLTPMLATGGRVARDHPHLAEAVTAFAHNGLSAAAAARVLHVHPNTQTYRLDRWHQLTGWNPRTYDGLVRSIVSITLWGENSSSGTELIPP